MHYVMDIQEKYVKKLGRALEKPELGVHDKPKQYESERQPEEAPAQGPPIPLLPALSDTQFVILYELVHLR